MVVSLIPFCFTSANNVAAFARSANGGLIVTASALSGMHRALIVALAARHKLPAVYYRRDFVTAIDDHGTDLMRKAFHERTGPLTDQSLPKAERESFAHLFAGAIGAYKNPHSHRKVTINSEAQRQVLQASHLLHIIDAAKARRPKKP